MIRMLTANSISYHASSVSSLHIWEDMFVKLVHTFVAIARCSYRIGCLVREKKMLAYASVSTFLGCSEDATSKKSLSPRTGLQVCPSLSCPTPAGFFAFPTDCGNYVKCSGGDPVTKACPEGLQFHPELRRCDYPHLVQVSWPHTPGLEEYNLCAIFTTLLVWRWNALLASNTE